MRNRDIKKELLKVKGGDFIEWYSSLTRLEKAEYQIMLEQLSEKFRKQVIFIVEPTLKGNII